MVVIYDEENKSVKLIEDVFNEVIFDIRIHDQLDVSVMIDFLLMYARIVSLG